MNKPMVSDRYRKGVPPAFAESQTKYLQDELTKLERVTDLTFDDVTEVTKNGLTLKAEIEAERDTRITETEALAFDILNLTTSVTTDRTNNAASFAEERTARTTATEAIVNQLTQLSTTVNTAKADITAETTARTTADSALSQRVTDLNTSLTTADTALGARITTEETARVQGDQAIAQTVTNLSTTVGGHTTTISQHTSSINGLSAKWGVRINNNNRVAGIQLNSAADGTSSFDIEANTLNLYVPGTNTKAIYWDGAELVVRGNIRATSITTDAVNNLGAEAIQRPVISNPNVIASGNFGTDKIAGWDASLFNGEGGYRDIDLFIPTGISVSDSWATASTNQYIASATIAAGQAFSGGTNGWSDVSVTVGDGIINGAPNDPPDNMLYVRYRFQPNPANQGAIRVTSINWKVVRI